MFDNIDYRFTDPLGIQKDYGYNASKSEDAYQYICDRLWLLVRRYRYPVFHDPTLAPDVVLVTRYDPHNMAPIERVRGSSWTNLGNYPTLQRSEHLRPCIYVAGADFIRALVARGNPPVSV